MTRQDENAENIHPVTGKVMGYMPAAEKLRELTSLKKAYEAEVSACLSYLHNTDRWQTELAREEQLLQWQQERVDRLKRRHGEEGEAHLFEMQTRLADVTKQLVMAQNQAKIEAMLRLAREIDELNGTAGALRAAATANTSTAACDAATGEPEAEVEEVTLRLVCDGCGHVEFGSEDVADTPCPKCDGGILTDPGNSDDVEPVVNDDGDEESGTDDQESGTGYEEE